MVSTAEQIQTIRTVSGMKTVKRIARLISPKRSAGSDEQQSLPRDAVAESPPLQRHDLPEGLCACTVCETSTLAASASLQASAHCTQATGQY